MVKLPFTPSTLLIEGPVLRTFISASRMEVEDGRALGLEFPELPVSALIDTGASLTVINPEIAVTCKLKQTGFQRVNAVGGATGEYPEYAAAIAFPNSNLPRLDTTRVVACPIIRQPFYACLIGRDILQKWLFKYDGRSGSIEIEA